MRRGFAYGGDDDVGPLPHAGGAAANADASEWEMLRQQLRSIEDRLAGIRQRLDRRDP